MNVFGYENRIYPLRISEEKQRKTQINLLLLEKDEKKHWCLIKNMSRLLSMQSSKHKETKFFCLNCLNHFSRKDLLEKHEEYCLNNEAVKIELLKVNEKTGEIPKIFFKNNNRSIRVPFIIYADFECFVKPIDSCEPSEEKSCTQKYQKHVPCGYCYWIKCFDDNLFSPKMFFFRTESEDESKANKDEDVSKKFFESIEERVKNLYKQFDFSKKLIMTKEDWIDFEKSENCWICEKLLEDDKVRNHCHFTGKYRGTAHK